MLLQMLSETKKAGEALGNGEAMLFASHVGAWTTLMNRVDALDAAYAQMPVPTSDAEALRALEGEIQALVAEIDVLHKNNGANAKAELNRYRADLKLVKKDTERIQSYINPFENSTDTHSRRLGQ